LFLKVYKFIVLLNLLLEPTMFARNLLTALYENSTKTTSKIFIGAANDNLDFEEAVLVESPHDELSFEEAILVGDSDHHGSDEAYKTAHPPQVSSIFMILAPDLHRVQQLDTTHVRDCLREVRKAIIRRSESERT
jgi:hypothetical protein